MTNEKRKAPPHAWRPGESGNPNGRPKSAGSVAQFREAIAEHVPGIIEKLKAAALDGDVSAARLLLERAVPPIKATEEATPLALSGETLTAQGRDVLAAVAAGDLAPSQGAALLSALGTMAKLAEVDELERRIQALEEKNQKAK